MSCLKRRDVRKYPVGVFSGATAVGFARQGLTPSLAKLLGRPSLAAWSFEHPRSVAKGCPGSRSSCLAQVHIFHIFPHGKAVKVENLDKSWIYWIWSPQHELGILLSWPFMMIQPAVGSTRATRRCGQVTKLREPLDWSEEEEGTFTTRRLGWKSSIQIYTVQYMQWWIHRHDCPLG